MALPIYQHGAREIKLGCVAPPTDFVSALPVFGETVETLDTKTLEVLAKNPVAVGRTMFDSSYIVHQGSYGSCNGCMGAGMVTRARVRVGHKLVHLSGSYLYSLINGNQDHGSTLDSGMEAIRKYGIATLNTVPINKIYRTQYDKSVADREAKKYRAEECYRLESIQELWTALALGWDCGVVVQAGNNFGNLDRNGVAGYTRGSGNHAVGADGLLWAGGEIVADSYNSWGTRYGDRGRMLLTKRHFEQTIKVHAFYAVRSVASDGDDRPPRPIAKKFAA